MKRSQMVKAIDDMIDSALRYESTALLAQDILALCETFGMKPPHSEDVFQKNARVFVFPDGYEWEKE